MTAGQRAELDALLRRLLMLRSGAFLFPGGAWHGACAKCGRTRPLQVSHIEPKGRVPSLRWDIENVVALCAGCHLFWWHKAPREAEAWITRYMGAARRDRLALRARAASGRAEYVGTRYYLLGLLRLVSPQAAPVRTGNGGPRA